jgi:hypothetical protein
LATYQEGIGGRALLAKNLFNNLFRIAKPDGVALVNGDQVTQIVARKVGDIWHVTFHLSDGNSHSVSGDWAKEFVESELIPTPETVTPR